MKKTKICALALSTCLALGVFAGCDDTKSSTGTSSSTDATSSETLDSIVFTDPDRDLPDPDGVVVDSDGGIAAPEPVIEPSASVMPSNDSSDGEVITFSGESQTNANTFISNFTEVYFENYDKETAGVDRYLDFVFIHFKINASSKIATEKKGDISYETFKVEDARNSIGKYFSYLLKDEDCQKLSAPPSTYGDQPSGPYYADGKIWYQLGGGDTYNLIGIVNSAKNNGDGTLTLNFTIYQIDLNTFEKLDSAGLKEYYKLTPEKAAANKTLTKVKTGTAKVGVGQTSYYMLSYKTV